MECARRRPRGDPPGESCGTTPRAHPDSAWLIEQLPGGAAAWAAACGTVPVAARAITKLSWLHRTASRRRGIISPTWPCRTTGSPCSSAGRLTTDRGDASGTGYWSPTDGAYRWDLLAIVDGSGLVGHRAEVLGPLDFAAGSWRGRRGAGYRHCASRYAGARCARVTW